jgi:hypothetical protein
MRKPGEFKAKRLRNQRRQRMFDSLKAIRDGGYATVVVNLQDGPWVCRVGPPAGDVAFDHGGKEFFTVHNYQKDGKYPAENGCVLLASRTEFVGSLVAKIRKVL